MLTYLLVTHHTPRVCLKRKLAMEELIGQCALPITVTSPANPRHKVKLRPKYPRLYSGSTLTTAINNLASMLIGLALSRAATASEENLMEAVATVGYVITLESCEKVEDLQFLKHSPCRDTRGIYRPLLNPGVLLRSSGCCKGDLPGRGDLQPRAEEFQRALLQGMYPRADFPLVRNMRRAVGGDAPFSDVMLEHAKKTGNLAYKVVEEEGETFHFSAEAVYRRYDLTSLDIALIDDEFATRGYRYFTANPSLSKILEKDYGLKCL